MTGAENDALVALVVVAAALAVPGWLLPLADGVKRFTWRYIACGVYAAAFAWYGSCGHPIWLKIAGWVVAYTLYQRARHWWQQAELVRKFERAVRRGGVVTIAKDKP